MNEYFREENLYQVPPQNHQWSIQLSELETLTGEFRYWSAIGASYVSSRGMAYRWKK
ncbi:hypothetical protein ACVPOS_02630 [Staphylococcus aureus]